MSSMKQSVKEFNKIIVLLFLSFFSLSTLLRIRIDDRLLYTDRDTKFCFTDFYYSVGDLPVEVSCVCS